MAAFWARSIRSIERMPARAGSDGPRRIEGALDAVLEQAPAHVRATIERDLTHLPPTETLELVLHPFRCRVSRRESDRVFGYGSDAPGVVTKYCYRAVGPDHVSAVCRVYSLARGSGKLTRAHVTRDGDGLAFRELLRSAAFPAAPRAPPEALVFVPATAAKNARGRV